jgi:hypothetical protein
VDDSFVSGRHDYLVPVTPDGGADGRGLARTWDWTATTREVPYDRLRDEAVDVVVLQRPHEVELVRRWLGPRARARPAGRLRRAQHPEG